MTSLNPVSPPRKRMLKFAFSTYVRSLDSRGEPSLEIFEDAWRKLSRILRSELRRRSLMHAPPSFLGIYGSKDWFSGSGALQELVQDCFTSVLVERLHLLRALLEKVEHVEGIVFGYICNFLHDRHRQHDPLGYRVFKVLRAAVRQGIAEGTFDVLAGDSRIRNDSVVASAPGACLQDAAADLTVLVKTWDSSFLCDLVTATPKELAQVSKTLCADLAGLETGVFRFGDLVRVTRNEVRTRREALWWSDEGETATEGVGEGRESVRCVPLQDCGGWLYFEQLWGWVSEQLRGEDKTRRTRQHLDKLWGFVRYWLQEAGEETLPAARELERLLGIPRKRIPELLVILRHLLSEARGEISARALMPPRPRRRRC
jgi:hypothetical protein